ncbi:hypothetical protein [Burkholderia vietnamiensis]|uniref:hypothetical protein n=1 Tax=Burkholderia vietnamiensis TaxID=60552 RepID=UPI00158D8DFF|nr:hypothetical protein [Burkholderia vietnamiensis]
MDQLSEKVATYQQRVKDFMVQAHGWCTAHGLRVEETPTHVLESYTPKYEARSIRILTVDSDIPIAEVLPTGSAIIGAHGRIDLRGRLARHAFLYQTGKGPGIGITTTAADGTISHEAPTPIYSGIDGDGWYWYEASIRKAKRVDEALFLDLITDVSDYEFQ